MPAMRRVLIVGLVLVVAVAGAGGIYFYRLTAPVEVSDQPPVAPTLAMPGVASSPTRPVAAGATPVGSAVAAVAGTPGTPPVVGSPTTGRVYRIDPKQSRASYAVGETFFFENNRHFTAVGTTSAVAGDILIDRANPGASQVGEIVIDISQLTSDDSRRDNAIRRQWLESARYPKVTFKTTAIEGLPATIADGTPYAFKLIGDLTIRTVTRGVTWDVTATLDGDVLRGKATVQIKMTDFGFQPPRLADIGVEDEVVLTIDFVATGVSASLPTARGDAD
jgi:polyisoprenoid-binding protein YceI